MGAVLSLAESHPTHAMSLPTRQTALIFASGGHFSLQMAYPASLGSNPDAAGSLVRARVSNPRPAGSSLREMVSNPAATGSIPEQMGWLPAPNGMRPTPRGIAPRSGGFHPAPQTCQPGACGIKPARLGIEPKWHRAATQPGTVNREPRKEPA